MRQSEIRRKTKETDITVRLDLDEAAAADVDTGIGFFDHMLTALAVHSGFGLQARCAGDLDVDGHHTVEDLGICIGQAFAECVGDRAGIARYGTFTVPMDEAIATVSLDISGRPYFVWDADFRTERIGELDTQLVAEFFRAFAVHAGITLHISSPYGENDHHKCEAVFKAFAHALGLAARQTGGGVLSSKGSL
jgi:imidazoleglycerol-phosphate dehydratase